MTRRDSIRVMALLAGPFARPGPGLARGAQPGPVAAPADLTTLSLTEVIAGVHAGRLVALDMAQAYLARITSLDRDLGAFITVTADLAREQARRIRRAPSPPGPLAGVPVAHKDLFETAGVRTTGGSRLFEQHVPARDATVAARLAAAGALTVGKTNTHELGGGVTTINPFFGTTRNPRDGDRIAGGSSGGSAAAVAARLALAATGSDTGGSIRIPAALCGCVGFKPTYGVLSTAGVLGASPTFDHTGFLTRSASDLVPLLRATMGLDPADPATVPTLVLRDASRPLHGLRIGVPRAYFFDGLDADVAGAMQAGLARLGRAGAAIRDVRVPVDGETMARVFDPIVVAEIHQTYQREWRDHPAAFSPAFAEVFRVPLPSALELAAAYRARRQFQTDMARAFDAVDVLAMPTVPVVAPPIRGPIDGALILRNTWPFNAAHLPAVSLPCGPADRLPVGLQLVAAPFDDGPLIRTAMAVERALR